MIPLGVALAPRRPPGAIGHRREAVRGAVDEFTDAHLLAVVEDPSTHGARRPTGARRGVTEKWAEWARASGRRARGDRRRARATTRDDARRVETLERAVRRGCETTTTRDDDDATMSTAGVESLCDAVRAVEPLATLSTTVDGTTTRVTCEETGHCVSWTEEGGRESAKAAMTAHVAGKKFAAALQAKEKRAALAQYAPHIVESKFVPGHVFCRLTGSRIKANEEAVVRHASGKRFSRAHAAAMAKKHALLEEKDPATEAEEKKSHMEAQVARSKANADAKEEKAKKLMEEKMKRAAEKKRRRENGGYDENMGCWVPPQRDIESDESDESDEEGEGSEDDDPEDADEGAQNDLEDDFYDDDDSSDDDENLIATVQAPGAPKRRRKGA